MMMKAIGLGTQLRHVLSLLDGDVQKIYDNAVAGYRPRFTPVARALLNKSPASIQEIVEFTGLTHSAASQTISLMTRDGWLERRKTSDGRQSAVAFTRKAEEALPRLEALWMATRCAADKLDEELSYPFSELLDELITLLEKKSFIQRIEEQK